MCVSGLRGVGELMTALQARSDTKTLCERVSRTGWREPSECTSVKDVQSDPPPIDDPAASPSRGRTRRGKERQWA